MPSISSRLRKKPLGTLLWMLWWALLAYQLWLFAHVLWYRNHAPGETAFMRDRLTDLRNQQPNAKLEYHWVPYPQMSRNIKSAVIAAEDSRFTVHRGFDWEGLQHAFNKNMARGRIVAGGSTITQQLAKNLFLSSSRNPLRKAQEAVITVMLELTLSKQRILELYLNVIEWGDRQYGIEAAARHYFRTSAARLTPYQSARLAAMITNPRFYQHHSRAGSLARKTSLYQQRMRQVRIP